jgi:hypothetical protein
MKKSLVIVFLAIFLNIPPRRFSQSIIITIHRPSLQGASAVRQKMRGAGRIWGFHTWLNEGSSEFSDQQITMFTFLEETQ